MPEAPAIGVTPHLRESIACDLSQVRLAAQKLRDFLSEQGRLSDECLMECELAFVEACNNAVLYTAAQARTLPITIEATCDTEEIEILIKDHTPGFLMPAEATLPEHENESGRGLFIIRSVMDEVTYEPNESGNTMRMVKHREPPSNRNHAAPDELTIYKCKLAESEQVISEMAEELSSCYETLSAIFRCGAELGKTNNIRTFAKSLCSDLLQITESDWYGLRVISEDGKRLVHFASSTPGATFESLPLVHSDALPSAEVSAARSRSDIWFNPRNPLAEGDPLLVFGRNARGMVHPILFADNLSGTLSVGKREGRPPFTAAQANIVQTFADFLAIQFINAQLQEDQIKHKLVTRELEIAKNIQRALLPKHLPQPCGFGVAGYCEFAQTVGGDFYDVVPVNENTLLLIIADVMGKGIPAAMFAAILRSLLRAAPELNRDPAALLQRVNRLLYEELSEVEMFITAQLACVDFEKREMIAASAGHCPILLGGKSSGTETISPDGIPIGILPEVTFETRVEALPPGAKLLFYTDGITDVRNPGGAFFTEDRLLSWFRCISTEARTAEELKSSLVGSLHTFQSDAASFDDQTFLIVAEQDSARR